MGGAAAQDAPVKQAALWHTTMTRVFLTLEGRTPEAIEHHRIVSEQDNLSEIELTTATREDRAVLNGGAAQGNTLTLPAPLQTGEVHEFWVRLQNPLRSRQFLYVPPRRCDYLELRIHFDSDNLPRGVTRLPGRPPHDYPSVPVNRVGEVMLVFGDPTAGTPHGARWD